MAAVGVRAPLLCSFQSEFRIPRLRDVCSILRGRGEGLVEGLKKKKIKKKKKDETSNAQCHVPLKTKRVAKCKIRSARGSSTLDADSWRGANRRVFLLCCLEPLDDGGASRGKEGEQRGERQRRMDGGWTPPIQLDMDRTRLQGWGLTGLTGVVGRGDEAEDT